LVGEDRGQNLRIDNLIHPTVIQPASQGAILLVAPLEGLEAIGHVEKQQIAINT